jgi:hypothetical protein
MIVERFRQEVARVLENAGDAEAFAAGMDVEMYLNEGIEPAYAIDKELKTWDQEAGHYV